MMVPAIRVDVAAARNAAAAAANRRAKPPRRRRGKPPPPLIAGEAPESDRLSKNWSPQSRQLGAHWEGAAGARRARAASEAEEDDHRWVRTSDACGSHHYISQLSAPSAPPPQFASEDALGAVDLTRERSAAALKGSPARQSQRAAAPVDAGHKETNYRGEVSPRYPAWSPNNKSEASSANKKEARPAVPPRRAPPAVKKMNEAFEDYHKGQRLPHESAAGWQGNNHKPQLARRKPKDANAVAIQRAVAERIAAKREAAERGAAAERSAAAAASGKEAARRSRREGRRSEATEGRRLEAANLPGAEERPRVDDREEELRRILAEKEENAKRLRQLQEMSADEQREAEMRALQYRHQQQQQHLQQQAQAQAHLAHLANDAAGERRGRGVQFQQTGQFADERTRHEAGHEAKPAFGSPHPMGRPRGHRVVNGSSYAAGEAFPVQGMEPAVRPDPYAQRQAYLKERAARLKEQERQLGDPNANDRQFGNYYAAKHQGSQIGAMLTNMA